MTHRTPVTARPQSWIISPWWDMTYVVITPVLIVPVILILGRQWLTPEQVSLAVISFASLGHHLPGFMRAYGDRELFQRYRLRFLLVPPLVFAMALCFTPPRGLAESLHLPWQHLHGLELVLLLWGTWHGLMQTYGFMRIYDLRRGVNDRWTARLDHWLCLAIFTAGVVFSDARMFGIAKTMWESGLPIFGPIWMDWLRLLVGGALGVILVAYFMNLLRLHRAGYPVSWVKILLVGITGWFFWYTGRLSVNLLIGIAMFEIYHAVQYYAIVWIYNKRLFNRAGDRFGPLGFLFQDRWSMLGLYLAAIAAYSSIRFFTVDSNAYIFSAGSQNAYQWLVAAFVTSSFLHFYFDGFIWKVSERKTQENLVDTPTSDAIPLFTVPAVVHAAKWAVLLAIVAGLLVAERKRMLREPEGGESQRLVALAALTPNLPECHALLSRDALSRGNAHQAIVHAEQALALRERSHTAHADMGLAYLLGNRLTDAQRQFEQAVALAPDQWSHHCDLGLVLQRLGEHDRSEEELRLAVELGPDTSEPLEQLADFYLLQNQTQKAVELYEILAERFPDSLTGELGKIHLLNRAGRYHEAVELASFLAADNANDWRVLTVLGASLNAAGDPQRAVAPLERALKLRPQAAELNYQMGLAQFQLNEPMQAIRYLKEALLLDPRHFAAQLQLANTYYLLGAFDSALGTYQQALDLRPGDPNASANYGGLLAQLGMNGEAERAYRAGLAEYPDAAQLNYNLGLLLWQKGKREEARQLVLRAERLGTTLSPEVKAAIGKSDN
ncbi:tetratricopeptide repeat protein [Bythopirellula polymerisocia]|uniref:Tetratricopeptide repeat protein n=1 Tax=Bythopirellula polymerisocia TaxID=2528003 RepID=A0A5C6CMF0_9BACT|nr:tetratricopeptide repeat protein [Bythopirellula polymerisocia]TWU25578.1 tetratricopeptide repeat protein [Bythopirellula polymerisocia]